MYGTLYVQYMVHDMKSLLMVDVRCTHTFTDLVVMAEIFISYRVLCYQSIYHSRSFKLKLCIETEMLEDQSPREVVHS